MRNIFKHVMMGNVGSNTFNLSHDVKMSFDMGELIPTCYLECLPGDLFTIGVENMLRLAPLVSPVMHEIVIDTHYFFVANRNLWEEWEDFITGKSSISHPTIWVTGALTDNHLGAYLGYRPFNGQVTQQNAFFIAAYANIYDEYYRDQNLITEKFSPLVPGDNPYLWPYASGEPFHRAWEHDYFTSSLPTAQQGSTVSLPLIQEGDVEVEYTLDNNSSPLLRDSATGALLPNRSINSDANSELEVGVGTPGLLDPNGTLVVDVNADAADINTLRRAFRLQEWLEKNMRGGQRYIEQMLSHFGVRSSDARLDRPEYIGGSKQRMVISEVLSTAQTVDQSSNDVPIGQMAGHGISVGGGNTWSYRCEEHGIIMGIISVRPRTAYFQGLEKSHRRLDKLDYAWPSFANIGEQEVKTWEVITSTDTFDNLDTVFGYVPRYSEYKFMNSRVCGEMRNTLKYWHLAREFATTPGLNESFITCDPDKRIFADQTGDTIYAHIFNNIRVRRKLPKFGIPSI